MSIYIADACQECGEILDGDPVCAYCGHCHACGGNG